VPHDPADIWRLAAALASPAATAWLARRTAGTALTPGAVRVAAPDLLVLPLPGDDGAWEGAAAAARLLVARPSPRGREALLASVAAAYDTPASVTEWWWRRAAATVERGRDGGPAHDDVSNGPERPGWR
jgi:hypothetical protein